MHDPGCGGYNPLRYLVEIGYENLLPQLFAKILIPTAVLGELCQEETPNHVRLWARNAPPWIEIHTVQAAATAHEAAGLDRGEWEAIELARAIHADLLLIDERAGVREARAQGFIVTGTLGVLVEAARRELVSIEEALARLTKTNFRRTPDLFERTANLVRKSNKTD